MELKQRALRFKNVRRIGEDDSRDILFEVGKEIVKIFRKPGRRLISCSCKNHARFPVEQPLCKHKLAAIKFWLEEESIVLMGWEETTEKETSKLHVRDFAVFTTDNNSRYFKRK